MRLVANNAENFVVEVHGVKIKKWYIDKFLNIYQQNALPNYKKIMMKIYQKKARGGIEEEGRCMCIGVRKSRVDYHRASVSVLESPVLWLGSCCVSFSGVGVPVAAALSAGLVFWGLRRAPPSHASPPLHESLRLRRRVTSSLV